MRVTQNGIDLIKFYEGCPTNKQGLCIPYICSAGYWTIGFGNRFLFDGSEVNSKTTPISKSDADRLFLIYIQSVELDILSVVKVDLTDNQLSALASFVYNLGIGRLKTSTLLKKLNKGDYAGAALEFSKWNNETKNGVLVPSPGLTKRRKAEQELFLTA